MASKTVSVPIEHMAKIDAVIAKCEETVTMVTRSWNQNKKELATTKSTLSVTEQNLGTTEKELETIKQTLLQTKQQLVGSKQEITALTSKLQQEQDSFNQQWN
jgi:chromosome segregation ATPase